MYTIGSLFQRICASIQPAAAVFCTGPTWKGWPVHAGQLPKQTKSLSLPDTQEDASAMRRPRCCAVFAVLFSGDPSAALAPPQQKKLFCHCFTVSCKTTRCALYKREVFCRQRLGTLEKVGVLPPPPLRRLSWREVTLLGEAL